MEPNADSANPTAPAPRSLPSLGGRSSIILFVQINNEMAAGGELVVVVGGQMGSVGGWAQLLRDLVCVCNFPRGERGGVRGSVGPGGGV